MVAAASLWENGYAADWLDELERVAAAAPSLSPAARGAVVAVLDLFAAEDGHLPEAGMRARIMLVSFVCEPVGCVKSVRSAKRGFGASDRTY